MFPSNRGVHAQLHTPTPYSFMELLSRASWTPRAPANTTEPVSGYYGRLLWKPQVSARASILHSMEVRERRRGEARRDKHTSGVGGREEGEAEKGDVCVSGGEGRHTQIMCPLHIRSAMHPYNTHPSEL